MDTVTRTAFLAKPEVKETAEGLRQDVRAALPNSDFRARGESPLAILDETMRSTLEAELQATADGLRDRQEVDGVEYKRHVPGVGKYHCLGGMVHVARDTYRQVGVKKGPTVVPLELIAGLAEGATSALGNNIVHGYAQRDTRQHAESLAAARRTPSPRATRERMAKRLAERADESAPRIEAVLCQTEMLPEGARAVCIGLDRTLVSMGEVRNATAPPKRVRRRREPRQRRAPKPIDVNYRMAYVGTVSIVEEHGETLVARRYPARACDAPLVAKMMADVRTAVRRQPSLTVGVVQEGALVMWDPTPDGLSKLRDDGLITRWEEGIDRHHLLERLGSALEFPERDAPTRLKKLRAWNDLLDAKDSGIDRIESQFAEACVALTEYIANNKDRMRCVIFSTTGLPIGSGVTESAAKTVIGRHAKSSDQCWSEPGLHGVLTLRAVHHSARLPRFWNHLSRRYTAAVVASTPTATRRCRRLRMHPPLARMVYRETM